MAPPSLRSETAGLVRLANSDLTRLWNLVLRGASAEVALRDLLPSIIREYGEMGSALAADWYDDQREKVGVGGSFAAIPKVAGDRGAQELVSWALAEATDDRSLQTLILGGVQRRVADHVRYTIAQSSVADPRARGWQRVGAGSCKTGFCDMLIGRGAVYSEASADFAAHDHCQCSAIPAWGGEPLPVKPFKPSTRNVSEADQRRVREWIAAH